MDLMTKDEVKQLQIGDIVEFVGSESVIFTGVVRSNSVATIFGTPIISVKTDVQTYDRFSGAKLGPSMPTLFNLKPKKIIRKV
jgi:hypothetical protein